MGRWFLVAAMVLAVPLVMADSCGSSSNPSGNNCYQADAPSENQHDFCVTVTSWSVGSSDIGGTILNATGSGCSKTEIYIDPYDHNNALVGDNSYYTGIGETPSATTIAWHVHMTSGLFGNGDNPLPSNVTHVVAYAVCDDIKQG